MNAFNFDELFKYIRFLDQFREVKRTIYATGTDRMENDVEHSYQLAMMAWFINKKLNLKLDGEKVLKYALAHDLVETFVGDVSFWDKVGRERKVEREERSLETMKKQFSESFPEMISMVENYELRDDRESKFVYALDKLIPMLNIYLDNGRSWHELYPDITVEKLLSNKRDKARSSEEVFELLNQFGEVLKQEKERLFGTV